MRDHCTGEGSKPSVHRYNSSNQRKGVCSERVGHTVAQTSPLGAFSVWLEMARAGQRWAGVEGRSRDVTVTMIYTLGSIEDTGFGIS